MTVIDSEVNQLCRVFYYYVPYYIKCEINSVNIYFFIPCCLRGLIEVFHVFQVLITGIYEAVFEMTCTLLSMIVFFTVFS
jgi:hypothetical protein